MISRIVKLQIYCILIEKYFDRSIFMKLQSIIDATHFQGEEQKFWEQF